MGYTPFHLALREKKYKIADWLLKKGAFVNSKTFGYRETPLIRVVLDGNFEMTQKLVDSGASVNVQDYKGRTPLYLAFLQDDLPAFKILLEAVPDPSIADYQGNLETDQILEKGHKTFMELLLKKKISLVKDCKGTFQ